MNFTKAHGAGNDFVLADEADAGTPPSAWARRICDRHVGVGADGVVLYTRKKDSVTMRLFNADGGEAEISGNGLRCLAALAVRNGWLPPHHTIWTAVGPREMDVGGGGSRFRVEATLGSPVLDSDAIPLLLDPPRAPVRDYPVEVAGRQLAITATSLGNPHCAVFLGEPASDALVGMIGPALEKHPLFPKRTNVEFITVLTRGKLRARFWERGVGLTSASGTGAASAVVASVLTDKTDRNVRVVCDGGEFEVSWPEGGSVRQVGDVELLFEGTWL